MTPASRLVERRQPRPIDEDMLRALWPSMLSDYDLADRLGHDRGVVRRKAAKLGLLPRRLARVRHQSSEHGKLVEHYSARYPQITDLVRRGYSAERIAELVYCEVWIAKLIKISGRF